MGTAYENRQVCSNTFCITLGILKPCAMFFKIILAFAWFNTNLYVERYRGIGGIVVVLLEPQGRVYIGVQGYLGVQVKLGPYGNGSYLYPKLP